MVANAAQLADALLANVDRVVRGKRDEIRLALCCLLTEGHLLLDDVPGVDGDRVEMTVTVHGEDYYNFNRGQSDIATDLKDDENGRFTELGWAKPFPSSGTVVRTITWTLGDVATAETTSTGSPERNPGREDNEIGRSSGDPDRTSMPENNRETGGTRVDG